MYKRMKANGTGITNITEDSLRTTVDTYLDTLNTYTPDGGHIKLVDWGDRDCVEQRAWLFRHARLYDMYHNAVVVALAGTRGDERPRFYEGLEHALRDIVWGRCNVYNSKTGDVYVLRDDERFVLFRVSNDYINLYREMDARPKYEGDLQDKYMYFYLANAEKGYEQLGDICNEFDKKRARCVEAEFAESKRSTKRDV